MAHALATPIQADRPDIRRIGFDDIRAALAAGYADFLAIPTQLVFLGLLYPVIGFVAARAATGDALPLLFPLVAGLSLMGPVLAVGMYELSRRREAGLAVSWLDAFDVFRSPAIVPIAVMGALLFAVFVLWIDAARAIFQSTVGAPPGGIGAFVDQVLHTAGGHRLILLGNLVGFAFALFVLAVSVVSLPMLLDRNCGLATAVQTSIRAVTRNPVPMAAWGVIVAALLALGSIPVFIGLAVVMPVLGHATWHLYRRLVA